MWTYVQLTGALWQDGAYICQGYSGFEEGKNNPAMQHVPNVGPIPCGRWTVGAPRDTPTHGPYVLSLTPAKDTKTFGRSAFLIHGDNIKKPGTASHGCIILGPKFRRQIWESGDHEIEVVAGDEERETQETIGG